MEEPTVFQLDYELPKDSIKNWLDRNSTNPPNLSVFHYEYFSVSLQPKKGDPLNIHKDRVPVLVVSNSTMVPRGQSVCLRSYDEYVQMSSFLRPFIRQNQFPSIPKMKRSEQEESILAFLKWCGSYGAIIQNVEVQLFIFTLKPVEEIIKCFNGADKRRRAPSRSEVFNSMPKTMLPHEEPYLVDMSLRQMFDHSSLGMTVEMGVDPLQDGVSLEDDGIDCRHFKETYLAKCAPTIIIHPEDQELFPRRTARSIKMSHVEVHFAQMINNMVIAPMLETPEESVPAWEWGGCNDGSSCPLHSMNEGLIRSYREKALNKFHQGIFSDDSDSPNELLKHLPAFPLNLIFTQIRRKVVKKPKKPVIRKCKLHADVSRQTISPHANTARSRAQKEESIEVLDVEEVHCSEDGRNSPSSSSLSSSMAVLTKEDSIRAVAAVVTSDDRSSFASISELPELESTRKDDGEDSSSFGTVSSGEEKKFAS